MIYYIENVIFYSLKRLFLWEVNDLDGYFMQRINKICIFIVIFVLSGAFLFGDALRISNSVAQQMGLPEPAQMISLSKVFSAPKLVGLKLNADNPLQFEFLVDQAGVANLSEAELMRLVNYFLAALTTSKDDIWVNLSPYEADRIVNDKLAQTDLGIDLMAQDYVLKQLSSSLTHPKTPLGKAYWEGNREQGIGDSFNKIWISPNKAEVYEQDNLILITDASLKVQTESDYLATKNSIVGDGLAPSQKRGQGQALSLQQEIERDVNQGKNFSKLRQIYNSIILAETFKAKFYKSFYKHYINQGKVNGIEINDKTSKEKIYNLYCEAFEKGVYNFIRKEKDVASNKKVVRHYFSGGVTSSSLNVRKKKDFSSIEWMERHSPFSLKVDLVTISSAMSALAFENYIPPMKLIRGQGPKKDLIIILAEDNKERANIYINLLNKLGHQVEWFNDGNKALAELTKNREKYDLLVTDNIMGRMNGVQLVTELEKAGIDLPILMQTRRPTDFLVQELELEIVNFSARGKDNFLRALQEEVAARGLQEKTSGSAIVADPVELLTSGQSLTILMSEDDEINYRAYKRMLSVKGHEVMHAPDGVVALDIINSGAHIDLIMTDNDMPNLQGIGLVAELKSHGVMVPILMHTAYPAGEEIIRMSKKYNVPVIHKDKMAGFINSPSVKYYNSKPSAVGGIDMADIGVSGIDSSSLYDNVEVDYLIFDLTSPSIVSVTKVSNI